MFVYQTLHFFGVAISVICINFHILFMYIRKHSILIHLYATYYTTYYTMSLRVPLIYLLLSVDIKGNELEIKIWKKIIFICTEEKRYQSYFWKRIDFHSWHCFALNSDINLIFKKIIFVTTLQMGINAVNSM